MPLIPSPTPLVDGAVASSEAVDEVLYRPLATPDNFEVINGRLDSTNATGVTVSNSKVQSGAFTLAEQVGATGRNDYFYQLFEGVTLPQIGSGPVAAAADLDNTSGASVGNYLFTNSDYVIIPAAAKHFYLPRTSNVLLFWHVETEAENLPYAAPPKVATTDPLAQNDSLSLKLFLDGQPVSNERRQLKATRNLLYGIPASAAQQNPYRRKWSGHCIVQLAAGWHNAGIGIAHQVYHVRTTTKRFGYVALRA
jgi:hypothetical protein